VPSSRYGCAISGLNALHIGLYLSDDLVWAFLVGYELAMLICTHYCFGSAKNEIAYLNWLQFYCSIMETRDAELVKCFSEGGITSD